MNRKHTIDSVRSMFEQIGYELLETTYKNNSTPLRVKCDNGHTTEISLRSFLRGRRCRYCYYERERIDRRLSYDYVKKYFAENGCELLDDHYKNAKTPMSYICLCGEKSEITFDNFRIGKRCRNCGTKSAAEKRRRSVDEVACYFAERGCTLLSTEYYNTHQILDYICECGNTSQITFSNFSQGQRCVECGVKKRIGQNNHNWKPEKTDEERLVGRATPENNQWRNLVFERDGYTCQCCGARNQKGRGSSIVLEAHHIESWSDRPELRYEVSNGITLCNLCHRGPKGFHSIYGYTNNTRKQLEEFFRKRMD